MPASPPPFDFSDKLGVRKVFDLSSPRQLLEKLTWENDQIKRMAAEDDPRVIFAAFNAAASAWHMIEWIETFWTLHPTESKPSVNVETYRKDVISRFPDLAVCQQLTNGWKHRVIDRTNNPTVQALQVLDVYVKMKDGQPDLDGRLAYSKLRPRIYIGTNSINLDLFFSQITEFWSSELDRLQFDPDFTVGAGIPHPGDRLSLVLALALRLRFHAMGT
jgi:hypothetical protein